MSEGTSKVLVWDSIALSPTLARVFSTCGALIIQQIHYWSSQNKQLRDGYYWVYKTYDQWEAALGDYSKKTIQRTMNQLKDDGAIVTANYNKLAYDKTVWYRVDPDRVLELVNEATPNRVYHLNEAGVIVPIPQDKMTRGGEQAYAPERIEVEETANSYSKNDGTHWSNCPHRIGQNVHIGKDKMTTPIPKTLIKNTGKNKSGTVCSAEGAKTMGKLTGGSAKDILGHYRKERDAKRGELNNANTPRSLELLWRALLTEHCEVKFVRAFSLAQLGQMKNLMKMLGPDKVAGVLTAVCSNWISFVKYAEANAGAFKCPQTPEIGFLLRYCEPAMNFTLAQSGEINCTADVPQTLTVVKPGDVTVQKAAEPKKRVLHFGKAKSKAADPAVPAQPNQPPATPSPVDTAAGESDQVSLDFLLGLDIDTI